MIEQNALIIDAHTEQWQVKKIRDEKILGPVDFGFHMNQQGDYFCMGIGLLAGSPLPGTHRLIITDKSPIWESFYISTMGGAGLKFVGLGVNYVAIKNKFSQHCILRITNYANHMAVHFEPVENIEKIWESGRKGVYALQDYVMQHCPECHAREICDSCRVIVAGPASVNSSIGALASSVNVKGVPTGADCWAGRGGFGSKLVQQHNIVAISYGGDYHNHGHLRDLNKINQVFTKVMGKRYMAAATDATVKYRYDPCLESGGTFGCNVTKLREWLTYLNWSSVYLDRDKRLEIYYRLVKEHYLRQFNEETIKPKNQRNCGEPCPAVCKKLKGHFKKDYEPYEALGPNCGVFDQRAAEKLNHFADSKGFDAIQVGNLVSWFMELLHNSVIAKEDFGIKRQPKWDLENFDVVNDSMHNAECAIEIIELVFRHEGKFLRYGIREAAKELDRLKGKQSLKYALFTPHGDKGCIAPNQYWVPAFFLPMPIQGKYFEDYTTDFKEPYQLGISSAERMIKELYSDNTGMCRFHRGWAEKVLPELINTLYGQNIDYYKHHKQLAHNIDEVHKKSRFWESERVIDVIMQYLQDLLTADQHNEALKKWVEKFRMGKWSAAKEYWEEASRGIEAGLRV
ncbi:aldehyde ferredoxin oxidoreductase [Candidatus Woesearchaeota archaeon]|nr:aldehyde ferredoxin oxidoreductase [Candidatus Woesearchaeota archaeon]